MEIKLAVQSLCWIVENYFMETLKWIATAFIIIPAVIITVAISSATHVYPFALFMVGHLLWAWFGFLQYDKPLIWLNIGLLPVDVYAMVIRS